MRNVTALGNLISWQKVDYDFNYHQMEFPCNINVLIASEGRSLLPVRNKEGRGVKPQGKAHALPRKTNKQTTTKPHRHTHSLPHLSGQAREGLAFLQVLMRPSRAKRWRLFPAGVTLSSCRHWPAGGGTDPPSGQQS